MGREAELERISAQAELGTQDGRAKRSREVVREARRKQWHSSSPDDRGEDPRETLDRVTLAKVNREADRIAERLDGVHTRAGISRALAKRVVDGQDLTEAVFATMNALKAAPGTICPIADVPDVPTDEVSVRGTIDTLWEPSDPAIQQVGLIADDTGRTKFTVWRKSQCTAVAEGETVRFRAAKVNWYQGQWSLALTYDSRIEFPERDPRWWDA